MLQLTADLSRCQGFTRYKQFRIDVLEIPFK